MEFATLDNGQLVPAPGHYSDVDGNRVTDVWNPGEAEHRAHGQLEVDRTPPASSAGTGRHWERIGWDDSSGRIVGTWTAVDDPPDPPRVWRRIIIWRELSLLHLWGTFRSILEAHDLVDGWNSTNDLQEDFDLGGVTVAQFIASVRPSLLISDAEWSRILAAAEVGNG